MQLQNNRINGGSSPQGDCLRFKDSFYVGQTSQNMADGQGLLCFNDLHMYVGGFRKNKFHGEGFFMFPLKGFLFAEFSEGKVNGDVFWVNERMNFSKGNLADKSEGMRFVSANAKGISKVNFGMTFGSKVVNKMKHKIAQRDLGLLDNGVSLARNAPRDAEERDTVGELPQAAGASEQDTRGGSTVEFSQRRSHRKKFVQNVHTPKNVMRYLKTMCLMSKEFYPEKDKHDKTSKYSSEIDRFRNTLQNLENANRFAKDHYYMKNKIMERPGFKGDGGIGTVFLPWGAFCKGLFRTASGLYFGRVQYMNGDFEWGFFRENFFHLQEHADEAPNQEALRTNQKEQQHTRLHGFGSRFYREKGLLVTGFFENGRLGGNYLLDFVDKGTFKFSRFEKDQLRKDYFYCEKAFDYSKMWAKLSIFWLNQLGKDFVSREGQIKNEIFEGGLRKTQKTSTKRGFLGSAKNRRAMEFKELQGESANGSGQVLLGPISGVAHRPRQHQLAQRERAIRARGAGPAQSIVSEANHRAAQKKRVIYQAAQVEADRQEELHEQHSKRNRGELTRRWFP